LIQAKLDNEIALKDLREEKEKLINELYSSRMELKKKFDELGKRNA
jgi:hypothetical protein